MDGVARCTRCNQKVQAPASFRGKTVRCPKCTQPFVVQFQVQNPSSPSSAARRAVAPRSPSGRRRSRRSAVGVAFKALFLLIVAGLLGGGWFLVSHANTPGAKGFRSQVVALAETKPKDTPPETKVAAPAEPKIEPGPLQPPNPEIKPDRPAEEVKTGALTTDPDVKQVAFFETKIRPVLVQHCYQCHSLEAEKANKLRGGLLLDSKAGWRKGGDSGPVIVAGNPVDSLLIKALRHDDLKMPPKGKLPAETIADFVKWVELGAPDPRVAPEAVVAKPPALKEPGKTWALQPLAGGEPPAVKNAAWARTPIDRFILAKLEEKGIAPNAIAGKEKLIRRAYYDLWGLPPTPAEIDAFVKDVSPDAYAKVIDRLLASERYGERWGRHWLDVVRYAESGGYEFDKDRPNAWRYRNFVIKALNQDMPYDQFIRWQIAGDLLEPGDYQATTATGFLVAGPFPGQKTAKTSEIIRYDHLDDMVSTIGNAMLGLSVGCARCHDHKFDPISHEDYYRLAACLTLTDSVETKLGDASLFVATEKVGGITYAAVDGQAAKVIDNVYFLARGEVERKNGLAKPGFLKALMSAPRKDEHWLNLDGEVHPRIALGSWITDADLGAGRLLARVIVNRLWQHHLGRGIVETPNDFGAQGEPPTHPELLDWLASELIRGGWKLKPLHKRIMTSAVYMQTGDGNPANLQADPLNRLWWRRPTRRLEAEAIRDALLAVGGQLDLSIQGPGTLDENQPRRSVYLTVKRSVPIPLLQLFDTPEAIQSVGARQTTTVPPQALAMLNAPFVRQRAAQLAQRIRPPNVQMLPKAIEDAYRIALGRRPTDSERNRMQLFITRQYGQTPEALNLGLTDFCQVVLCLDEFVYID